MSFLEHLDELRRRIIYALSAVGVGFAVAYAYIDPIFAFIMRPMQQMLPAGQTLIYTEPTEGFMLMIKIGLKVGTERLSRYVQLYGFGRPVSPDFPAESPGIVWDPSKWTESALASVSMGYQIGVTPLQMVAAIGSVANGGEFVEPRVVRALYRDDRRIAVTPKITAALQSGVAAAALVARRVPPFGGGDNSSQAPARPSCAPPRAHLGAQTSRSPGPPAPGEGG